MTLDDNHINECMTHEEAADLYMNSMVGQASGVSREHFLTLLRERFPHQDDLTAFFRTAKAILASRVADVTGPIVKPHQRLFDCTIGSNDAYIICSTCGKTSYHPQDIKNRYCGLCKKFHKG